MQPGVDRIKFAKKFDLPSFESGIDELDIGILEILHLI